MPIILSISSVARAVIDRVWWSKAIERVWGDDKVRVKSQPDHVKHVCKCEKRSMCRMKLLSV
jgi:hypothetical protein